MPSRRVISVERPSGIETKTENQLGEKALTVVDHLVHPTGEKLERRPAEEF